ncbi:hypothetical protein QG37_04643 [Candidozyma auris]|uniref:Uncharacterized protein n=1 Tax=Candidozyma auris TaxID=498019 RepID=A0A0L0NX02_CANAR|nr:hypothetical protein QG37_04643 [[Candida] auris]
MGTEDIDVEGAGREPVGVEDDGGAEVAVMATGVAGTAGAVDVVGAAEAVGGCPSAGLS